MNDQQSLMNKTEELAAELGRYLTQYRWQITTAESCTGGGLAHAITSVAGSSHWFELGFVTYSNRVKQEELQVSPELLAEYGAVSEQVVIAMATGALSKAQADIAVAVSGVAGPDGGTPQKPVGTVWIAWVMRGGKQFSQLYELSGNREQIRHQTVLAALQGLNRRLKNTV